MSNSFLGLVRTVRSADLPRVKSIIEEWQAEGDSTVASIKATLAGAKAWQYWIAEEPNRGIVGIIGLATSDVDPELASSTASVAELVSAYVTHDARGAGAGRALADQVESEAAQLGFDTLLIVSGSRNRESGYPFWHRRYGDPLRVDQNYFGPGAERVVWAKVLPRKK